LNDIQDLLLHKTGFIADADDEVAFGHNCSCLGFYAERLYRRMNVCPGSGWVKLVINKEFRTRPRDERGASTSVV
jgi:hypothetical protein